MGQDWNIDKSEIWNKKEKWTKMKNGQKWKRDKNEKKTKMENGQKRKKGQKLKGTKIKLRITGKKENGIQEKSYSIPKYWGKNLTKGNFSRDKNWRNMKN